jgi:hypothetical protein
MKLSKLLLYSALILSLSFLTISCGNNTTSKEKMEEGDMSGPEYSSAYICPMHCAGSGSDSEGTCPVCGMTYVENKESTDHENHEGHNH